MFCEQMGSKLMTRWTNTRFFSSNCEIFPFWIKISYAFKKEANKINLLMRKYSLHRNDAHLPKRLKTKAKRNATNSICGDSGDRVLWSGNFSRFPLSLSLTSTWLITSNSLMYDTCCVFYSSSSFSLLIQHHRTHMWEE